MPDDRQPRAEARDLHGRTFRHTQQPVVADKVAGGDEVGVGGGDQPAPAGGLSGAGPDRRPQS
jgi:hypothetical protein